MRLFRRSTSEKSPGLSGVLSPPSVTAMLHAEKRVTPKPANRYRAVPVVGRASLERPMTQEERSQK